MIYGTLSKLFRESICSHGRRFAVLLSFDRIKWGGTRVFDTTLKRAARAGIDLIVLQQLGDLDTPADIETLRETEPELVERLLDAAGQAEKASQPDRK